MTKIQIHKNLEINNFISSCQKFSFSQYTIQCESCLMRTENFRSLLPPCLQEQQDSLSNQVDKQDYQIPKALNVIGLVSDTITNVSNN